MQLKSGKGRGFTSITFGKCPYYIEHVPEQMLRWFPTIIFCMAQCIFFTFL